MKSILEAHMLWIGYIKPNIPSPAKPSLDPSKNI